MFNVELDPHLTFDIKHSTFNLPAAHGGEGGIRTPDTRKGITVFETAAFSHSATSPYHSDACAVAGKMPAEERAIVPPRIRRRLPGGDSDEDPARDCRGSRKSRLSDRT